MRVGSRQNHAGNGYGQQVERRKTNWRDASDIHSFFFTRFPEEMNESDLWLERKPDSLVVRGLKMHVNTPKHGRERVTLEEVSRGRRQKKGHEEANGKDKHKMEGNHVDTKMKQFQQKKEATSYLNINVEEKTWLRNTRVRRLKNLTLFDRMEDDFMWNGGEDITPKYIGDDMILLMGLRETRATPMAKEANEQGSSSLEKWTPQLRIGYRLV
ncbi:hypothetical protein JHK82_048790 [Glycine max]|uniref:DUF4283 domain-containing protein n=1 Tax=Glycine max TaxID=3847 RepID=K7MNT2_SOYBN|nr:hypothetical protein JHK86_048639 [Glycine max]KAG4944642.1 hypothetical protein JHK85_049288 [Glycine max]KAG5098936.1 hypothetical protein JHK82_048790 [Glycine max]KAG5103704.1 hypothetical protein JHK84_048673 [Glycine max]KAH1120010.1 hypothetical protein GYH30_048387 [Glycine max]